MATETNSGSLLGPGDMQVIERVLGMKSGYVLDLDNQAFDHFLSHEIGIDATAPRYSVDGASKAKRLRRILHSLPADRLAKLLRAFLEYHDKPSTKSADRLLDDEWRLAYDQIISALEHSVGEDSLNPDTNSYSSSSWTGRRTIGEQIALVKGLAPTALQELDELANLVERRRFNDPVTADAVQCLRDLHQQLGDLLKAVDRGAMTQTAVEAIERNRRKLLHYLTEGAKVSVAAPAMTLGVVHILSWVTGVPIDSTLASTVYGSIVGADVLKSMSKISSLKN